jgi:hypothetical protein
MKDDKQYVRNDWVFYFGGLCGDYYFDADGNFIGIQEFGDDYSWM